MTSRIRRSTAGATLVAAVGLLVLAAGAVAAVKLIGSGQVQNGSLTSIDIKNESLTGVDVKNGSVKSVDIGTGAIGAADLAAGSVGSSELADASISSNHIQDGAVTSAKLAAGAVGARELAPSLNLLRASASLAGSASVAAGEASKTVAAGTIQQPAGSSVIVTFNAAVASTACTAGDTIGGSATLNLKAGTELVGTSMVQFTIPVTVGKAAASTVVLPPQPAARALTAEVVLAGCSDFTPTFKGLGITYGAQLISS